MKHSYREYFANVKKYVKMKPFLKEAGITESNFSMFMKGEAYDWCMSVEKLNILKNLIEEFALKIV